MKSIIKYMPKKLAALFLLLAMIIVPAALWATSGPSRPTYTWNNAPTHITFNSMTDNANWNTYTGTGDERNFVAAEPVGNIANGSINSMLTGGLRPDTIAVEAGKEYYVGMLVHNDAYTPLNLVAENVKAKVTMPTGSGKSLSIRGDISSTNANPTNVYDDVTFTSNSDFTLSYVAGSAHYFNNQDVYTLPDSELLGSGTKLGYTSLDGRIPGCWEYRGYLFFKVKANAVVTPPKVPNYNLKKTVDKATAGLTDTIKYTLEFTNSGETDLTNVVIKDQLPSQLYWTKIEVSATLTEGLPAQSTYSSLFTDNGLKFNKVWVGGKVTITVTTVVNVSQISPNDCDKQLPLVNRSTSTTTEKPTESNTTDNNVETKLNVVCQKPNDPCPTNPKIEKTDPKCIPPCQWNPNIPSNDPGCVPPQTPCTWNPSIPSTDPNCKAPNGGGNTERPGPGGGTIIATGPTEFIATLIAVGALTFGVVAYIKSRKHLESVKNK
ncbi:hypothetical protein FWF74_00430 [Candidatus Saccharibacteria bacterium]|nr:hypothetical protein [Candidatus Saccharibacteria bacterium]MCL1963146.1 hypothetical protein [Candidatus Saccharibacteria bacterium]